MRFCNNFDVSISFPMRDRSGMSNRLETCITHIKRYEKDVCGFKKDLKLKITESWYRETVPHIEGVRVPIAKLPDINDLVLRLNEKLFQEAESRLKEQRADVYLDDNNATPKQLKLTANDTNYYDSGTTVSDLEDDNQRVGFYDPVDPQYVNVPEDHPTRIHLGLDLQISLKLTVIFPSLIKISCILKS